MVQWLRLWPPNTGGPGSIPGQRTRSHKEVTSESESRSVVSDSLRPHGQYNPWNSPGQNTGVGSRSLLQRIFPTQGSNVGLLNCRQILYQLSHQGSPEHSVFSKTCPPEKLFRKPKLLGFYESLTSLGEEMPKSGCL